MKDKWKKTIQFLKNPNLYLLCGNWALTLAGIVGCIVLVSLGYMGVFSIIVYVISAISLSYSIYTAVLFAPTLKERFDKVLQKNDFTHKLSKDYSFRTLIFATCSFIINIGFVVFNLVLAILSRTVWYGSLAGYYFLLSILRGGVFFGEKKAKELAKDETEYQLRRWKNYKICGIALFVLDIVMAGAVTLMVLLQKPSNYTDIMAIAFAAYSFYKIILAIYNIFKARKTKDAQIQSFRNISLADAAVSLLSLQVTMVATFSVDGENMALLNALTGAFVCLLTIGIGVFMIINGDKELKKYKTK